MFRSAKKFLTVASLLTLCSEQLCAMTPGTDDRDTSSNGIRSRRDEGDHFHRPAEIWELVVVKATVAHCLEHQNPVNLALVSSEWREIVKKQMRLRQTIDGQTLCNPGLGYKVWYGIFSPAAEAVFQRFLRGALIYRPNPESDEGMVVMPIADLLNPLEGTFDLFPYGDAKQHFSISTGYRKEKKAENDDKVEICVAPHFLIERNLAGNAAHYKPIMANWNAATAPVGIFWAWGSEDLKEYDYLTTQSMDILGSENLCLKRRRAKCCGGAPAIQRARNFKLRL